MTPKLICGFAIETGVPIPPKMRTNGPIGDLLRGMEVGESVLITNEDDYRKVRNGLSHRYPLRFAVRKIVHEGWRVWRVA